MPSLIKNTALYTKKCIQASKEISLIAKFWSRSPNWILIYWSKKWMRESFRETWKGLPMNVLRMSLQPLKTYKSCFIILSPLIKILKLILTYSPTMPSGSYCFQNIMVIIKMFITVIISLWTASLLFKRPHKFNSASIRNITKLMLQYLNQTVKESSNVERW